MNINVNLDSITVEVYKLDGRCKAGRKLVEKVDLDNLDAYIAFADAYPTDAKFKFEIHKTYVQQRSMMDPSITFYERYDTPYYCSPSSETYWSM